MAIFRLGELFCGPGGLAWGATNADIGLDDYGIIHEWANDYDSDTCNTYRRNICPQAPNSVIWGDAGSVHADSKVLFARVDEAKKLAEFEEIRQKQIAEAQAAAKAEEKPEKPEGCALIGIEDFMGVELRTAQVISCERVPKAKKLLLMKVDLGYETRQVVSGIAKFYEPEQMIGKKIILVANLKPATLCGIESQGMILASGEETVRVVFLAEDTPLGERVR